jgi:two-component system, OmpR family, alkaline phosphatase synthesis response regulator PhoP
MADVARILVIEDSQDIADLVTHYLTGAGYETTMTANGSEGLRLARAAPPDAIVLDLMLPGLDGLNVCQALRAEPRTAAIPIIMLTARTDEIDRIRGLEFGADDYVTKPFSPKELVARVGALLRRVSRSAPAGKILTHGPLTIDIDKHLVEIDGESIRLTAKEFLLLRYLIEHRGRVLSRDQLLTDVWSYQYTGGTRTVDVHIRRLREKVPFLSTAIATVKQFGYKLEDPATSP